MTKQEFIDKILESRLLCIKYRENVLITEEQKEFYQALNILNESFEKNIFNPQCFVMIDAAFHAYKMDLNSNIHLIAHLINIGINYYDDKQIKNSLDSVIARAKKCPNEVSVPAIATMTSEEYDFQYSEMQKEVQKLKKYVDENGNILPVSPEKSNPLDFKYVFKIEEAQVNAIIKACNKKYFQLQKQPKRKKELVINQSGSVSKSSDEILEETKQKNLAYNKVAKFISMDSNKYQVITNNYVTEDEKIEIMRLAKIIGISEENQKKILQNIEIHNATLLTKKDELKLKEQQEQLMLAIEQTKATYFTEQMHLNYNKVLSIINDVSNINDQSLNYIIAKLKVAKESIDATVLGLIKEDLILDDFKELLALTFEDLNNVLLEAKHYNVINQSLERVRKES